MITLAFAKPQLQSLRDGLYHESLESAAILLCVPVKSETNSGWRLLVRELHIASGDDYLDRTSISIRLNPNFCLPLEKKARSNRWSLVYVHTHPHQQQPSFSSIDDGAEIALAQYTSERIPDVPHMALLFGETKALARVLGTRELSRVVEIGPDIKVASDPSEPVLLEERFDRQIRAFGREGQARIEQMLVGIVGVGGTGSLVLQQLAHLGVRNFLVVDHDTIEASNLNRVVGARSSDVSTTLKVDIAERQVVGLHPDARINKIALDVTDGQVARQLADADFLFNCTDTQASRHVLNQLAYQYRVPVIDLGVSITVADAVARFAGHVKMLAPSLPCLWCTRHLDAGQVRQELMTEAHRAADPYFQGTGGVLQPAVISLNGVVASVAVTMFLAAVAGVPAPARYVIYDGNRSRMNAVTAETDPACNFCGPDSTAGWGDVYPLPIRRHD